MYGSKPQPLADMPPALQDHEQAQVLTTRAMVGRALAEGRVCVVYQPVVDAKRVTHVAFYEALIRLRTTSGKLMSPGQFLPAVAGTSLAAELDCAALRFALEELQNARSARISVNIAAASLDSDLWMDTLAEFVDVQPELAFRLIVEVTEDAGTLDHPNCTRFLADLRARGVSVALDDFGAGATGFSHFRNHRFDIVKIDGSFGDGLDGDIDAQVLVKVLLEIADHFEMLTVLEYIDNPADAGCAMRLGVDAMQGFLFGRPAETLAPPRSSSDGRKNGTS
ncbi:MAG: EAL domain-containing protein [Pseudomonadota bacterium]